MNDADVGPAARRSASQNEGDAGFFSFSHGSDYSPFGIEKRMTGN
jgi:hypothetical protein